MQKYRLTGKAIAVGRFLIGKEWVKKEKLTDKEGEILFKEKSPYIELVPELETKTVTNSK